MSQIRIQFNSVFCSFPDGVPEDVDEMLYDKFRYHPEGYFFSTKYQMGQWDGYNRLYYHTTKRFRTGLLSHVTETITEMGYEVSVDGFPESTTYQRRGDNYTLRDYQVAGVESMLKYRYGVVQAPVRSGKTQMFIGAIDSERSFPAIFLCRSLDLAYQTVDRMKTFLPEVSVGIIGDGKVDIQDVTIVTVQSAFSAYDKKYSERNLYKESAVGNKFVVRELLRKAKTVFFDEVHHVGSKTAKFVLDKCQSATLRIGLSATPFSGKEEDILVEEAIGPIIHKVSYSELIRAGMILRPYIYMYKLPRMAVHGNYQSIYRQAVVDNEFLMGLVKRLVDKLTSAGKSVVVQTEFVKHSFVLGKYLGAAVLTGKEKAEYRKRVLDKMRSKDILCLVSTVVEEGIDLASLDYTINLVGGKSDIGTMQRMRSMTASEGKTTCGIIDFFFDCKYMKDHSKLRKKCYQSEPEFKFFERDVSAKSLEEIN